MRIVPDAKARENSESKLSVTRFKVLTLRLPGDQYEVVVLDCMSGQPVEGAVVTLYTNDEKKLLLIPKERQHSPINVNTAI